MHNADLLLRSSAIFTPQKPKPFAGFVAIRGKQILSVDAGSGQEYIGSNTRIFDLEDKLICPGFADVHCFFNGYLLTVSGLDLSACKSSDDVLSSIAEYSASQPTEVPFVLGRNIPDNLCKPDDQVLDKFLGDKPAVLFTRSGESCWMNAVARKVYEFTPQTCWSESYWRLLRDVIGNFKDSVPAFQNYIKMLHSRGITSIKEMGFDDYYGFTDALETLEKEKKLFMRYHFMSQPVGKPMDLDFGKAMRKRFQNDFVRFSGYNQMTDGSIGQYEGEMKQPYVGTDFLCSKLIDWRQLSNDVVSADSNNFRFSLHAQGDGALSNVLDIYEKLRRDKNGKLLLRHAITDIECSDPADLKRMGKLGAIAEIYPQIMSVAHRDSKLAMIDEKIGAARGRNFWNRRKMADSGIVISCATDLPLLIDDIPESIYHSVGCRFPEGGEPFNPNNGLNIHELLTAWTFGGQHNLGRENELGTLDAGKLADIAVLDANVFDVPISQVRDVKVCLTIVDGKIVYSNL